nr:MAG: hypothetical protein TU36_05695 [Vulcanisaeta sp. AZ3]
MRVIKKDMKIAENPRINNVFLAIKVEIYRINDKGCLKPNLNCSFLGSHDKSNHEYNTPTVKRIKVITLLNNK